MKTGTILVIVVSLAVYSFGVPLRSDNTHDILSEIDGTSFGNTILSTIAIQLATNGPMEEIAVALNQVRKILENQQEEDDSANRTSQAQCDTTLSTFKKQISVHSQQKTENNKILEVNKAALEQAHKDLNEDLQALATNSKRLTEGQNTRDVQHQEYVKNLDEHEQGIKSIDNALQLLMHLKSGASFIQLKNRINEVTQELVATQEKSSQGHLYTPLIESLSQLAEKASPDLIDKITKLFNELRQTFVKDKQSITNIENQQMEAWTSLKADLQTERETLQAKRSDLERQIEGYKKIMSDATKNVQFHTEELAQAQSNVKHQSASCARMSTGYLQRTNDRKRERDIIIRVIDHFEKKMKSMSDFVKGRVDSSTL